VIKVTCALIIDNENRIFAAQRSPVMSLPLKWEFPGGKIEPNETPEGCLIREIQEELNIEVKIIRELPTNTHSYPNITIELIPFICKHKNGEILLKEHAEFRWLYKNELLVLDWAEADIPIVKYYLNI
jgi:8-oxo-dGTP diphosphatase